MMIKNLDHERAAYAYEHVGIIKKIGGSTEEKYYSTVRSSGVLIHNSGLIQTLLFYLSKIEKEPILYWNNVNTEPINHRNFLKYLKHEININWVEDATVNIIENGRIIKVSKDDNLLELKIDNIGNQRVFKINGNQIYDLKFKFECNKSYILKKNGHELLAEHIFQWKYNGRKKDPMDILIEIIDCSDEELMYKTLEAKYIVKWLKKFAEAIPRLL